MGKHRRGCGSTRFSSEAGACGCVREPGSLTLPFGVGFVVFSTKSKKPQTLPEWAGTPLRACFARLQAQLAAGLNPAERFTCIVFCIRWDVRIASFALPIVQLDCSLRQEGVHNPQAVPDWDNLSMVQSEQDTAQINYARCAAAIATYTINVPKCEHLRFQEYCMKLSNDEQNIAVVELMEKNILHLPDNLVSGLHTGERFIVLRNGDHHSVTQ